MEFETKLTHADLRLLTIIWAAEPLTSPDLCKLAEKQLGWKCTTTYTVLKRLCEKGAAQNDNTHVASCISRADVQRLESRRVMERAFSGSLPQFIAAFLGSEKRISAEEAEQLKKLIDSYRKGP